MKSFDYHVSARQLAARIWHPVIIIISSLIRRSRLSFFGDDKELKEEATGWLKAEAADFYADGIFKLEQRCNT